jgi:hypothetical protein
LSRLPSSGFLPSYWLWYYGSHDCDFDRLTCSACIHLPSRRFEVFIFAPGACNTDSQRPMLFFTRRINNKPLTVIGSNKNGRRKLLFKSVPDLQAAHSMPIVETAYPKTVVDMGTSMVHSYETIDSVSPAQSVWYQVFV